jgi:hypothetical protein
LAVNKAEKQKNRKTEKQKNRKTEKQKKLFWRRKKCKDVPF